MPAPKSSRRCAALAVFVTSLTSAFAAPPVELAVHPKIVELDGPRDSVQVVVTGKTPDGRLVDLTGAATAVGGNVRVEEGLFVRGAKDGTGTLTIQAAGATATIPVTVKNLSVPRPASFRREVIAAFNVSGCNLGSCHGTPSGKNGFKLSLRGFDPAADHIQLTREQFGRRTDRLAPAESLVLKKALGTVPHEGGARMTPSGVPTAALAAWLEQGMPDDPADLPPVAKIEVFPGSRLLVKNPTPQPPPRNGEGEQNPPHYGEGGSRSEPGRVFNKTQQLAVVATFADKAIRDVTRLTSFSSSDETIASVSANGFVEFKRPGEVAVLCRYLEEMRSVRLTYLEPRAGFAWPSVPENNAVDAHVFAKLKQMTILPSELCTDAEFVRRVYLDVIGRLPTTAETQAFHDGGANRDALIDALVAKPEFADFWAQKWADVLRASRKALQAKGTAGFQLWLRGRLAENAPFDAIARELLTASGSPAVNPAANYYRVVKDPTALAEGAAQLFLGARMQCAKCHNHPFERWTQDDYYGLAAVFARVKTKPDPALPPPAKNDRAAPEIVCAARDGEVAHPRTNKPMPPRFPGGGEAKIEKGADRRAAFADWLTTPGNPFFARGIANRVWFHLMGRGIVEPVDDFRDSNPPANDELLDFLARDFAAHGFDLRHLVVTILKSRTYQLSATPNESNESDAKYFSHAVTKLLPAEVLLDAVCDATGVPERFAGLPAGTRAVQLPDPDGNHPFLKAFGQPARELACECEREADGNLAQALQLMNGPTMAAKLKDANNRVGKRLAANAPAEAVLNDLYMAAYSRPPTAAESAAALAHVAKATDKRRAWEDVLWAVLNSREFLFRH